MGYHRAGFEVIGVDNRPQPHYPFAFIQADAMTYPLDGFDTIHASPPCQAYSQMTGCRPGLAEQYPELIDATRALLRRQSAPWVLENVDGAGLAEQDDLFGVHGTLLCGAMFGRALYRHRLFETSFPLAAPHHPRHLTPSSRAGHHNPGTVISVAGNCSPVALAREVMGIDWTTRDELAEAIPPAYTEYIGRQLLDHLAACEVT